jgi:hypothetical protein
MCEDDVWPAPEFDPGKPKHLHAIGLFSLSFAQFQASLENLYLATMTKQGVPRELAAFFYSNLTEDNRVVAVRTIFNSPEWNYDPTVIAAIENLLEFYAWSKECRNNILHAEHYPALWGKKDLLHLTKKTKARESIYLKIGLDHLRSIADNTREGVRQSAAITLHLRVRGVKPQDVPEAYKQFQSLPPHLKIPNPIRVTKTP